MADDRSARGPRNRDPGIRVRTELGALIAEADADGPHDELAAFRLVSPGTPDVIRESRHENSVTLGLADPCR